MQHQSPKQILRRKVDRAFSVLQVHLSNLKQRRSSTSTSGVQASAYVARRGSYEQSK